MMDTKPDTKIPVESPLVPEAGLSVGATLRAAREAQGLKIEDVAERVKFSVRQVEALEADDLAHLPQGTFLRGFIRSYARALHLDEVALLAAIPQKAEPQPEVGDAQSGGEAFSTTGSSRQKSIYLLVGALVVALVLVAFVWSHSETSKLENTVVEDVRLPEVMAASAPVATSAPAAVSAPVAASAVAAQPAVTPAIPLEPRKIPPREEAKKTLPPEPKKTPEPMRTPEPKKAAPRVLPKEEKPVAVTAPVKVSAEPAKPEISQEQLKKRPVHIVFTSDVWMEITDKDGVVLLSRTTQAGEEKWVGGRNRAPYHVTIGKAGTVRIYNKGREVDLSRYKQAGIVKLDLE